MTKSLLTKKDIELFIKEVVKDIKPVQPLLLNKKQLSQLLGVSLDTMGNIIKRGLPNSNYGGKLKKYYLPEVVRWLEKKGLQRYLSKLYPEN